MREETRCRHMGYTFRLTARALLYAPSHRQACTVVEYWLEREIAQWVHPMKDPSDDPSHHERTLLPRSYISLPGASVSRTAHYYKHSVLDIITGVARPSGWGGWGGGAWTRNSEGRTQINGFILVEGLLN